MSSGGATCVLKPCQRWSFRSYGAPPFAGSERTTIIRPLRGPPVEDNPMTMDHCPPVRSLSGRTRPNECNADGRLFGRSGMLVEDACHVRTMSAGGVGRHECKKSKSQTTISREVPTHSFQILGTWSLFGNCFLDLLPCVISESIHHAGHINNEPRLIAGVRWVLPPPHPTAHEQPVDHHSATRPMLYRHHEGLAASRLATRRSSVPLPRSH